MDVDSIYNQRSHIPCDTFDLKQDVLGESCNLDGRTGGLMVTKELGIDAIDGAKVVHVLQEHLSPTSDFALLAPRKQRVIGYARWF